MKKHIVLIAGIVWSCCAGAQQTDTISGYHQTEDVVIVARATDGWGPFNAVSPLKRKQWIGSDLGSFLDAQGLAHQLTAGAPGAAGSLRFHGLSSDHTLLTWYGMPINSFTLGTCDMSLLPMFLKRLPSAAACSRAWVQRLVWATRMLKRLLLRFSRRTIR